MLAEDAAALRLKIPVVGIVVTSGRPRVGYAHLDLRSNRPTDLEHYVLAISKDAESCTLSAQTIVPIHQRFKEASFYVADGRTLGNKFSLSMSAQPNRQFWTSGRLLRSWTLTPTEALK